MHKTIRLWWGAYHTSKPPGWMKEAFSRYCCCFPFVPCHGGNNRIMKLLLKQSSFLLLSQVFYYARSIGYTSQSVLHGRGTRKRIAVQLCLARNPLSILNVQQILQLKSAPIYSADTRLAGCMEVKRIMSSWLFITSHAGWGSEKKGWNWAPASKRTVSMWIGRQLLQWISHIKVN